MPRVPLHALIWSNDHSAYELHTQGQLEQRLQPMDDAAWLAWVREVSSFAFHSPSGSLNVYRERRPRGGSYWYAYHTSQGRTHKRYLGRTGSISLARLEETAKVLTHEHSSTPAPEQEMTLLASRLTPPRLPPLLVERARLLAALDGALSTPLTLLSASAGWGKTTLLSAWANQQKAHVAWLSLDELDNSLTRFWVLLIAALRRCGQYPPNLGETALALLQSPQPPPLSACLSALLNELESRERQEVHPAPIILILDDYQVISDPAIHQGLSFWLEHLPTHVHLILSSRVDPDLPLARLRARGQMTEIRTDDLRFHRDEASDFLSQMLSPTLTAEEVHLLVARTEGWIAGLQLAVLTLQRRHEDRATVLRALTGSQRYLLDYVQEEILARLPTSVREFLLHIAILSRLDAAMCQAVTAEPTIAACQHMLSILERHNLFLVPLDEERRWYRLHDLFREALLASLHTTYPELVPVLHRRAAAFHEAQGAWAEAITHWLAAEGFSAAARLMEQAVEQFWVQGEAAMMANWVLALPQSLDRKHARLALTTALYLLNTVAQTTREQRARVHQQVRQLMARVDTALQTQADETNPELAAPGAGTGAVVPPRDLEARAAEEALLCRRLSLLRLLLGFLEAMASGDHERLNGMQQEIEEALDQDEEAIWRIIPLACSFVLYFTVRQEGARLLPRLLEARQQMSQPESHFATIKVRQYLALAAVEAGHLRLASEESQAALDQIEQVAGYALLKGYFEIVLAQVWYQWNRLEEARGCLQRVLHDAVAWQQLDLLGWGYADLFQLALAAGDWSLAELSRHELEQLVPRERFGTYPGWLPTMRAQWWLAQGKLQEASNWAEAVVFPPGVWDGGMYAAFPIVVRVSFAKLRFQEALALLECWSGHLDRPANVRITLTFLAQYLVALHQTGKTDQAHHVAARLFALTEPEGYVRVYLDEGEPMRQALLAWLTARSQHHQQASFDTAYVAKLLAAFESEQHGASTSLEEAVPLALSPTLTSRERDVLRLLATGASNHEIAQSLVISLATVKKHVGNVLGKLGATNRTQAIVQARLLSLL